MLTSNKKVINGWAMYDWANSVYNLVITSTIFPAYYEAVTKSDGNDKLHFFGRTYSNTSFYNYAIATSILIVAILIPILGSIADYKGNKKSFMRFFCTIGALACASMFFFKNKADTGFGVACAMVACICYWCSLVFYNSYLPEIASKEEQDKVSAKGFSFGYVGSVIMQVIALVLILTQPKDNQSFATQLSFLLVGAWWLGFAQIPLAVLPKGIATAERPEKGIVANGFIELNNVWKQIKQLPVLRRFLTSFFFYNMGVQTVMLVAALFGAKELNLPTDKLIMVILIIQLVAILGAYLVAKLAGKIGNLQTLCFIVVFWIAICICAYFIQNATQFNILAACVGLVMGGIQSLSRSTYSKLMPATHDTASFFSFFDVTEKIAIVIGMVSFALLEESTGSMRISVLMVAVFFCIGLLLLLVTLRKQKQLNK
jgi:MFS transporter, UMF1 family